jgi:predicted  nucleic acid-binding Zn-ribbon protein
VTTSRFLPLLNLAGCLLITGIILAQWLKERGLDARIDSLQHQLLATRGQYEDEKKRVVALEHDITQLKESIESTVQARKETEDAMAKMIAEQQARAATMATANQSNLEQAKVWEKAIADRDEKIRALSSALAATRQRLDEAIAKLKEAGAR